MSLFKEFKKNPIAPLLLLMFLNEDKSYSVEAFSMAVEMQNNTAMYGPLTEKAWYSQNNAPGSRKRLDAFLKFSPKWSKESLSNVLNKYTKGIDGVLSGDEVKTNYLNTKTNIEVIVDNENNYFRIYDHNKNQYLGSDGKIPSTGSLQGQAAKDHVQASTHFVNTDK